MNLQINRLVIIFFLMIFSRGYAQQSNFIESEIGNYKIIKDSLNYKITSNLINVPLNDYNLVISKLDNTKLMNLKTVNIKQYLGKSIRLITTPEDAAIPFPPLNLR